MMWIEEVKRGLQVSDETLNDIGVLLQIDRNSIVGQKLIKAFKAIGQALAAIPDEDPMVTTLRHLKRLEVMHHKSREKFKARGWEDLALSAAACEADYKALIDWIRFRFGYKLEEGG